MAQGIDVYTRYQSVTDWRGVRRAGYEFCYVKVSDGDENRPDNGYGPAGRAAGVAMGAYHYAQFGDPVAQADRLVDRAVTASLTDLAPALDLEDPFTGDQRAVDFAVAFLRRVRDRGHLPCLYASNNVLTAIVAKVRSAIPETLVWAARYGAEPTVSHDVWQWSNTGRVPGVAGTVDLNRGVVPRNDLRSPAGVPALEDLYAEDAMARLPKGGTEGGIGQAVNYQLAVSMLREHDVIIAPGDMPVVVYASYHWAWNTGTGGNPVEDPNNPVVVPVQGSYSYIVPQGTGKVDLVYWSDDDFSVLVSPR